MHQLPICFALLTSYNILPLAEFNSSYYSAALVFVFSKPFLFSVSNLKNVSNLAEEYFSFCSFVFSFLTATTIGFGTFWWGAMNTRQRRLYNRCLLISDILIFIWLQIASAFFGGHTARWKLLVSHPLSLYEHIIRTCLAIQLNSVTVVCSDYVYILSSELLVIGMGCAWMVHGVQSCI